jgi:hypothetical protein
MTSNQNDQKAKAIKDLCKVAIVFKLLERGAISRMSDKDIDKVLEWLGWKHDSRARVSGVLSRHATLSVRFLSLPE